MTRRQRREIRGARHAIRVLRRDPLYLDYAIDMAVNKEGVLVFADLLRANAMAERAAKAVR